MGIQLRISLPDQPGALARAAHALSRVGADILSVTVLESEGGRAVDNLRIRWPAAAPADPLVDAVQRCPGMQVLGCRRTRWLLDGRPDLDLLTYLLAVPERGMETLVDMAPAALDADWAELRPPARRLPTVYGTCTPARDDLAPESMPVRAQAGTGPDGTHWAHLPLMPVRCVLVLGRDGGPAWLRSELSHAERVVSLAVKTLESVLRGPLAPADPTELTAHLASA